MWKNAADLEKAVLERLGLYLPNENEPPHESMTRIVELAKILGRKINYVEAVMGPPGGLDTLIVRFDSDGEVPRGDYAEPFKAANRYLCSENSILFRKLAERPLGDLDTGMNSLARVGPVGDVRQRVGQAGALTEQGATIEADKDTAGASDKK